MPAVAILILPGFALAYVMNSGTVLAGNDGLTSMISGVRAMLATGIVSRIKLNLRLSYSVALMALLDVAISKV